MSDLEHISTYEPWLNDLFFVTKNEYDIYIFKYSSQTKFLISPCFVIVLLLNEKLFLAAAF